MILIFDHFFRISIFFLITVTAIIISTRIFCLNSSKRVAEFHIYVRFSIIKCNFTVDREVTKTTSLGFSENLTVDLDFYNKSQKIYLI